MIPRAYITEWRATAPWSPDAWVEQDLVLSRALVEIYRVDDIAARLAFRGGTALYKLHLRPPARYSEDIDLVQVLPGPIGQTLDLVRAVLDPWLGAPRRKAKEGRIDLVYRFDSEDAPPLKMRLKIEINTREHFSQQRLARVPFRVENRWFNGEAEISTFTLEELHGTKLRALYQRKKGRDLFDLWYALSRGDVEVGALMSCFDRYLTEGGHRVSRAQFEANLQAKAGEPDFRGDVLPLLGPGVSWSFDDALGLVQRQLVSRLSGEPWKGGSFP